MENLNILSRDILVTLALKTDHISTTSQDTYNESLLFEKFKQLPEDAREALYGCALQTAIIGSGGKKLGKVKVGDKEFDCREVLQKYGVKSDNQKDAKLDPADLTLRRLVRLLRYQIQAHISKTKQTSYLYRKYCVNKIGVDPVMVFPGAEHLVETVEDATVLFNCYSLIDSRLSTRFVDRLQRVLLARGINLNDQ